MDNKIIIDSLKAPTGIFNPLHPQASSFFNLFPFPDGSISLSTFFARQFEQLWNENFQDQPWTFIGFSALKLDLDGQSAEEGGNDYKCRVKAHFGNGDDKKSLYIDDVPYPNNDGEFVINGNRYFIPMFLRDTKQQKSMETDRTYFRELKEISDNKHLSDIEIDELKRKLSEKREQEKKDVSEIPHSRHTDNLHVILLDELLQNGLNNLLENKFRKSKANPGGPDIPKQYMDLRNKLLHPFIIKYGQLVDKDNPLSRISQLKELSFYGFWGGLHPDSTKEYLLRDISEDDLYRICPVQTPQGHQVGLRLFLARHASIDMQTRKIAAPKSPETGDSLSDAASLIPFVEHNDVARALMGSNMMKQALPLIQPDIPWIQTGWEGRLADISITPDDFKRDGLLCMGKNLTAAYLPWGLDTFEDGIVISESASKALAAYEEKTYWLEVDNKFIHNRHIVETIVSRDNPRITEENKRCLDESGIIKMGTDVQPGDILVSAFDALSSETIKKSDIIDMYARNIKSEYKAIKNNSLYVPANYSGKVIKIIDLKDNKTKRRIGIVIRHESKVSIGDKICSRHGSKGVVVRILNDCEMPYQKTDKQDCYHQDCSIKEPHRHIQVILNPIGVIGRLNIGQLYETTLAKIAERENKTFIVKPFQNNWSREKLSEELKSHGLRDNGMEQLFLFEEGKERPLTFSSLVGPQYLLRLHHLSEHKIQARGIEEPFDYTVRDNQPKTGKRVSGKRIIGSAQRVGEMEVWALAAHGAWNILDDIMNVKSDDELLRRQSKIGNIITDKSIRRPQALVNLILVFRSLCLNLQLFNKEGKDVTNDFIESKSGVAFCKMSLSWAKENQVANWNIADEVTSERLFRSEKGTANQEFDPNGLYSRTIFPPYENWKMGKITLSKPVMHPANSDLQMTIIPVLPKIFRLEREITTNFRHDLNVLYQHVIYANKRLASILENNNSEAEAKKWFEILQRRIEHLFFGYKQTMKGIYDILSGKKGLIRGHMAGKRADYSGRAVIVADPLLDLDQVSIPKVLWDQFFPGIDPSGEPFLLINRQPSLHRYSFLSFKATLHQYGNVIGMNPYVCKPFNADFDGDTVSIHVPRIQPAKEEAERLLPSHNLLSQANGKPVLGFEKDIALGVIYISYNSMINSDEDVPLTTEADYPLQNLGLWEKVVYQNTETTVGRLQLRRLFPEEFSMKNCSIDIKIWDRMLSDLFNIATDTGNSQLINNFTQKLSRLLIPILKQSGLSLNLFDFKPLESLQQDASFLFFLSQTGKYNANLEKQIIKSRGIMRKPGSDEPTTKVPSNLMDGHSETEYLTTAHGARSGLVDKGVITAPAGSALRKWIYNLQHLYIVADDCKSPTGFNGNEVDKKQIVGIRYDTGGNLITDLLQNPLFRSPVTCQASDEHGNPGICAKCYGNDPATGRLPEIGLPVGILAAQSLGERVSQETMKSFHTGGTQKAETDEMEKAGIDLIDELMNSLTDFKKGNKEAFQAIQNMWKYFPGSNKPRMVHFEVLVKGYKDEYNGLISTIVKTQDKRQIFKLASSEQTDNLFSVMSRIITGKVIADTSMEESND